MAESWSAPPGLTLVRLLGRGGMGSVFLATREADGQLVALKVASPALGAQGVARLRREAELLGRVTSPHLPRFLGVMTHAGHLVVAMEFIAGVSLAPLVDDPPSPAQRLGLIQRVVPGIAAGLAALHAAGVVHRDLKPANCMDAGARGGVVVDLGLARAPGVETLTGTGLSVGTPDYLPPEQMGGEVVDARADLYQVGLIVRDLLLGSRRAAGENPMAHLMRRAVERPEDVRAKAPWVPKELARWISAALHPDAAARPEPAAALVDLARLCAALDPTEAAQVVGEGPTMPSWFTDQSFVDLSQVRAEAKARGWRDEGAGVAPEDSEEPIAAVRAAERSIRDVVAENASVRQRGEGGASAGRRWLLPACLAAAVGAFAGASWNRGGSPPLAAPRIRLDLVGNRLVLADDSSPDLDVVAVTPPGLSFTRGPDGRLAVSLPAGANAEVRLRVAESTRSFGIPIVGRGWLQGAPDEAWLRFDEPTTRPTSLRYDGVSQVPETGDDVAFALAPSFFRASVATLVYSFPGDVDVRVPLDLDALIREDAASLVVPAPAQRADGSFDWSRHKNLDPLVGRLGPVLTMETLPEDLRQAKYDALLPFALEEWRSRDLPMGHLFAANRSLGGLLGMQDQFRMTFPARGMQRYYNFHQKFEARFGARPLRAFLQGTPPPDSLAGHFEEGVLVGTFTGIPAESPRYAEIWVQTQGTGPKTCLEVTFGERHVVLPTVRDYAVVGHRVPGAWLRGARVNRDSVSLRFGFFEGAGCEAVTEARLNWANLFLVGDKE